MGEGYDITLAAPTGRAAKRMSETSGYEAKTIHRLLGAGGPNDGKTYTGFEHDIDNPVETDVLILDEPENHLHPEWQIVYAHSLILLQKAFHLTVLVTSHSEFFVNALQRFAISEGIADKTHFYVSRKDDARPGYFTFDDKGVFASQIFRSFNRAYDRLGEMSGEIETEGVEE